MILKWSLDGRRKYLARWVVVSTTFVVTAAGAAFMFYVTDRANAAEVATTVPTPEDASPAVTAGDAGMRVYIDPETGEFTPRPPEGAAAPVISAESALNQSSEGLVEEPGPLGGVKVNLQGRFQSHVTAHLTENGELAYQCSSHPEGTPHPGAHGESKVTP